MITTKIAIEPYIAEYIKGKYYDSETEVVKFPSGSDLYVLLYDLMAKRPGDRPIDHGNLEIFLPSRRAGKDPMTYNYLSGRSQKIIESRMRSLLWAELHTAVDEDKHLRGIQFNESVYIFMQRYGIESISEDGLLKNYQRWRDKLRRRKKRGYSWKK